MSAAREAAHDAFAVFCRENHPGQGFIAGAIDAALAAYEAARDPKMRPEIMEKIKRGLAAGLPGHAEITPDAINHPFEWTKDGKYGTGGGSSKDLIFPTPPAREPMQIWVNVYPGNGFTAHGSKEKAERVFGNNALCSAVPFVEVMEP